MLQLKQQTQTTFVTADIKDAVKFSSLMDNLVEVINHNRAVEKYMALPKDEKEKYKCIYDRCVDIYGIKLIEDLYNFLTACGLVHLNELKENGNELELIENKNE